MISKTNLIKSDLVGPELVLWPPAVAVLRAKCTVDMEAHLREIGFSRVDTPYIVRWKTYEQYKQQLGLSETWLRSREGQRIVDPVMEPGDDYCIGTSKAVCHIQISKTEYKSYKGLPIKYYEFGEIYEPGPPVQNSFGLTLSVFDRKSVELQTKIGELADKHGFDWFHKSKSTIIDGEYVDEANSKKPICISYYEFKFKIRETNG